MPTKGVAFLDSGDDPMSPYKSLEVMSAYRRHHKMNEGRIVSVSEVMLYLGEGHVTTI